MRILIADDDRDLTGAIAARCAAAGWQVITAHDGFTTLLLARSEHPDVVCLDVEMPGGGGLGVCEMLSSDEEFSATPVIVITGCQDAEVVRRCHHLCAYYIPKCPDVWQRLEPLLVELSSPEPSTV